MTTRDSHPRRLRVRRYTPCVIEGDYDYDVGAPTYSSFDRAESWWSRLWRRDRSRYLALTDRGVPGITTSCPVTDREWSDVIAPPG